MEFLYYLQTIRNRFFDRFMVYITRHGDAGYVWILIGIMLLFFKSSRLVGVTVFIALLLSVIFGNGLLKNIIKRSRPCWVDKSIELLITNPKDYSFPSGHTMSSFAAATAIFCYNYKYGIVAIVLAGLIGFSRLYLFVHYPSDVIVGSILGTVLGIIAYQGILYLR